MLQCTKKSEISIFIYLFLFCFVFEETDYLKGLFKHTNIAKSLIVDLNDFFFILTFKTSTIFTYL